MSSKFFIAVFTGFLIALPFLFPGLFLIAWLSLIPLLWLLQEAETPKLAFVFGWIAGAVANAAEFYWLDYTIRVYGGYPYGVSEFIFLLFICYSALPVGLFSLAARSAGAGPLRLLPAVFWVAIEFWFPLLFPWHLANSQAVFLPFIQSADLMGPYGASFILIWANSVIFTVAFSPGERAGVLRREGLLLGLLLVAVFLYGHLRLKEVAVEMRAAPALTVAAVQGDIGIQQKWDAARLESNLKSYQQLTTRAHGAALVVWPETAVEGWLPENIARLPREIVPALAPHVGWIFGARSFRGDPAGPDLKAFNSAFLADAEGRVLGYYHKQVLLAFGEYLPFAPLLSRLPGIPPLGDGFTPGDGPRTLDLPEGIKIAPLICYEDLMPELARRFVADRGANLLVNLTNDAWFGDTAAPWQHARLAAWRAIETRRYLVRATNTGLTSFIGPTGELLETLPLFSRSVLIARVGLMEGETFYVRFGDWFAWLATLVSVGILLLRFRPARRVQSD